MRYLATYWTHRRPWGNLQICSHWARDEDHTWVKQLMSEAESLWRTGLSLWLMGFNSNWKQCQNWTELQHTQRSGWYKAKKKSMHILVTRGEIFSVKCRWRKKNSGFVLLPSSCWHLCRAHCWASINPSLGGRASCPPTNLIRNFSPERRRLDLAW